MKSSIVVNTLTDGSKTFDVVFVEGAAKVVIFCANETSAQQVQECLLIHAEFATIDPI